MNKKVAITLGAVIVAGAIGFGGFMLNSSAKPEYDSTAIPNTPTVYNIAQATGVEGAENWIQLDQLKTYNQGFRQSFDELFNINIISEGTGGKSGCIYVTLSDSTEVRSGNTTLEDALRNKVFVTKYFNTAGVQKGLVDIASQAYTDIDENSPYALQASINAYFNLMEDTENPDSFNATQSMSREQFYTMVFKAAEPVKDLEYNASTDMFTMLMGGQSSQYTQYASKVADFGFLQTANKSLDGSNIGGTISRAEAIYMIVNQYFADELAETTGKESAFSDTKNAGDLALSLKFKEEVTKERTNAETGKTEKYKEMVLKERWQSYTLSSMFKNPDKGMQDELYRAMVVAKQVGLIDDAESRWDEALSKSEAVDIIINTHLALNDIHGYLTTSEYPTMVVDIHGAVNPSETPTKENPEILENGVIHYIDDDGNDVYIDPVQDTILEGNGSNIDKDGNPIGGDTQPDLESIKPAETKPTETKPTETTPSTSKVPGDTNGDGVLSDEEINALFGSNNGFGSGRIDESTISPGNTNDGVIFK